MTGVIPPDRAGSTAGVVTRAAAIVTDVVVIASTFYGGIALGSLTVEILRFHRPDATAVPGLVASALLVGWTGLYFWIGWWLFGKTVGKALLGLRVVRADGYPLGWGRSLVRVGGYALSALALGIGFAWVAVDRRRRAWHDVLAGTRVVYDWHVHGAGLRASTAGTGRAEPVQWPPGRESPRARAVSPDGDEALSLPAAGSSATGEAQRVEVAMPGIVYEVRVRGDVSGHLEELRDGVDVATESVLRAVVPDQAALHGLLTRITGAGLELVDVRPTGDGQEGDEP